MSEKENEGAILENTEENFDNALRFSPIAEDEPEDTTKKYTADDVASFLLQYKDESSKYSLDMKIGEGRFGDVFLARDGDEGKCAVKKLKDLTKNFHYVRREIDILNDLENENVIHLVEVCKWRDAQQEPTLSLVFQFCCHDLRGLMMKGKSLGLSVPEKSVIMQQVFRGVEYIHGKQIIHRDLKPENILIDEAGVVKITDFGSARYHRETLEDEPNHYTPGWFSLAYKPPEISLGDRNYNQSADMWSVGCILGELMRDQPLFPAQNPALSPEQNLVSLMYDIVQICGPISNDVWPKVSLLPNFKGLAKNFTLHHREEPRIKNKGFKNSFRCPAAFDLFSKLVVLNPKDRMTAFFALHHPFCPKEPVNLQDSLAKLDGMHLHWLSVNKKPGTDKN